MGLHKNGFPWYFVGWRTHVANYTRGYGWIRNSKKIAGFGKASYP